MKNRQTVGEMGEFNLIERIRKILPAPTAQDLLVDIGDDTAVIKIDRNRVLLVTCDIQLEGRHFRFDFITPYQLGRRAMAVNLSDIAAMGGTPTYALVSLGLPAGFPLESYDQLFMGMRDELHAHHACIVGGNLARTSDILMVDITLLGESEISRLRLRSGARAGDRIFVTGTLGEAGAGFRVLEIYGKKFPAKFKKMVECHLQPTPRMELGRRIADCGMTTAQIDLSDGLAGDLHHICTQSRVGAQIQADWLPLPPHIEEIARLSGHSSIDLALHSGEDYELLFTARPAISRQELQFITGNSGISVTEIGKIVEPEEGYFLVNSQGEKSPITPQGWDHFKQ